MTRTVLSLLCALASTSVVAARPNAEWTWIHGQLEDAARQREYLAFASRMFEHYQDRGLLSGRLVAERELESWPPDHVVFIGPIQAFDEPGRFGLPLVVSDDDGVTVGGQDLRQPRTGIYLAGEDGTRYAYTGLSLDGFRDVFTVPTGGNACTVTHGRGMILFEGDYGAGGLALEALPFLSPYPGAEELQGLVLPPGAIEVEPVLVEPGLDALEPEFTDWLDGFVEGQRVLFFGESHWSTGVNLLFNGIAEHLLETGRLRAVFLEINYSFSGFYDYYVTEPDEERARRFLESRLHPLVTSPSALDLLELLRGWNLDHPDRQVHVGCLDMEWSATSVATYIIQPFLKRVDPDYRMPDPYMMQQAGGAALRERVQELLVEAEEQGITGEYPFLTPEYMDTVVVNLWDTLDIEDFNADRQRGIIRNVTEFQGELLGDGLALFKGGGWHAVKRKLDGESFRRDAAHLHEVHPPTRGKVATLHARSLGYSFAEIADLNLDQHMPSATNYNDYVRNYQKALAAGRAERDAFYLLDHGSMGLLDSLIARIGHDSQRDILRVDSVDWEMLTRLHGEGVGQGRIRDYDATVYVLRSEIEVMRPRRLERR